MVGPTQPSAHSVTVLGFGEEQDQEKIFVASAEQGKDQYERPLLSTIFTKRQLNIVCKSTLHNRKRYNINRVGNLDFSALALWASNVQIVLARIRFHSLNTPFPPPPPPQKKKKKK